MPSSTSSIDVSAIISTQVRHLGFKRLVVERPYAEPGVYIGDEHTELIAVMCPGGVKYANMFAQSVRMFALLQQAQAALPDAWAASKFGVPRELIEEIEKTLEEAKKPVEGNPFHGSISISL